jgi:hypothetical protein
MARGPGSEHQVDPPVVEKEQTTAEGSGSPAKLRERRTNEARDPARPSEPGVPSTEAVVRGDEVIHGAQ